ncbi:N-acetylmuramoyl-L-alanine amidase [Sulfitobacter sp. D35]|uniref:N-acetylmuramoyl-L-alanine amidase n=1 Tax=Sulfitobacter sp. D35 TaxID=3083252 RepID=UPI00296EE2AA|nr:N-acetylmuramoyl-L-alanine amidase [Sulfitobacter sp. D35]MDW4499604.1 N-acetylmuramoyl-L-alanine amidase [Sulfitobacter sp. D35]
MADGGPVIAEHLSPNRGARRNGLTPSLVVLHYTAMASAEAAVERLCDPRWEVSAHYLVARDGRITRMVPEAERAWHAGAGEWMGQDDINSRSIGIELDNDGVAPFSAPLMDALERLLADILSRHGIAPQGVIGHSDMAPGRKHDPGPRFDWVRLARQGLAGNTDAPAQNAEDGVADVDAFRRAVHAIGYTAQVPDEVLLEAVRLRFAPWRRGPLSRADFDLSHNL